MDVVTKPGIEIREDTDQEFEPLYHLILLDDQYHSYNYVVLMLGAVFGYGVEKAYALACIVDSEGQAIVMTGSHDETRRKQDQIHAFGPDPMLTECKGSMSAVIEPAS
jgi:ATP-dependent Clp protease adaptor protein ClpS